MAYLLEWILVFAGSLAIGKAVDIVRSTRPTIAEHDEAGDIAESPGYGIVNRLAADRELVNRAQVLLSAMSLDTARDSTLVHDWLKRWHANPADMTLLTDAYQVFVRTDAGNMHGEVQEWITSYHRREA